VWEGSARGLLVCGRGGDAVSVGGVRFACIDVSVDLTLLSQRLCMDVCIHMHVCNIHAYENWHTYTLTIINSHTYTYIYTYTHVYVYTVRV